MAKTKHLKKNRKGGGWVIQIREPGTDDWRLFGGDRWIYARKHTAEKRIKKQAAWLNIQRKNWRVTLYGPIK